ncbi:MAG: outer membrane beta-barrel protein [Methylocystis sp.]|nr:outer membrane beta-barrel protein [Methylocystis sp.]
MRRDRGGGALSCALFGAILTTMALTIPANAADMAYPAAAAEPVNEGPFEWGNGWYLRGDIAWQHVEAPAISGDFGSNINKKDLFSGGLGVGYQWNDWIRTDFTVDRSVFRANGPVGQLWCPYALVRLLDPITNSDVGILANPNETCTRYANATLNRTSFMFNGYLDLYHIWGLTPYIGGGVGVSYNQASSALVYRRNSDGGIWAPDLTLPSGAVPQWIYLNGAPFPIQLPFGPTNWNTAQSKKSWQFAWNVMAGVSYDVSEYLKADVGYRYLNAGTYTSLPSFGGGLGAQKDITSHEVRLGFRLIAN